MPGQYTYLFAIGLIFAMLDAYSIGANDCANSFATSVSSRSLKLWQAVILAGLGEFLGAVLLGSNVTSTIKNGIVPASAFNEEPYVLMLLMTCALFASSTWLLAATLIGLPVSTTHCIVGAIVGGGVAALGIQGPNWGWSHGSGIAAIIASWFIAPAIAGAFAAILFLITKYLVLIRKESLRKGILLTPAYFGLTMGVLTMVIVWKGAPALKLDKLSVYAIVGSIFGVIGVTLILCGLFIVPYFWQRLVREDHRVKWYHVFKGPLILSTVPELGGYSGSVVQDFYRGHVTKGNNETRSLEMSSPVPPTPAPLESVDKLRLMYRVWIFLQRTVFYGLFVDVVEEQKKVGTGVQKFMSGNKDAVHAQADRFDNKTEYLYSLLQVFTATIAAFSHGSNDVSNAAGPLTAVYQIWKSGTSAAQMPVEIWILAVMGAMIVIGLATLGWTIMRVLGNRITLHSPSRGFCMELGAALTVVLASRFGIPISTTQCLVGATVAVGICNGSWRALNWRVVAWCYAGWIITLPITAVLSGVLLAIILNAPKMGGHLV